MINAPDQSKRNRSQNVLYITVNVI